LGSRLIISAKLLFPQNNLKSHGFV
jgi:hypothetical protein